MLSTDVDPSYVGISSARRGSWPTRASAQFVNTVPQGSGNGVDFADCYDPVGIYLPNRGLWVSSFHSLRLGFLLRGMGMAGPTVQR